MRLPQAFTLSAIQDSFREVHDRLRPLDQKVIPLSGGRVTGAGKAINGFDYVRKVEMDHEVARLQGELTALRREFEEWKARFYGTVELPLPPGSR